MQSHVEVTLGHVINVNAVLVLGEITQTVEVQAQGVQVETTSTQLGSVMNSRAVVNLPLNSRDTYQLLQLCREFSRSRATICSRGARTRAWYQ